MPGAILIPRLRRRCSIMLGGSVRLALIVLACIYPGHAVCDEYEPAYRVLILADEGQPAHKELVALVRNILGPSARPRIDLTVQQTAEATKPISERDTPSDLVVTVGTRAFELALASELRIPVFAVLVPKVTFDELLHKRLRRLHAGGRAVTAIYLEQSPSLQVELARQIFPRVRNIGIALGPTTTGIAEMVGNATRQYGLALHVGLAEDDSRLPGTLDELLPKCDVLLGIVDPLIIGRTNAQSVLLAAYRHRVPLIGPSLSFVQAGALAAAYSTVPQVARELTDWLERWRPGDELPTARYPRQFSIAVNYRVAESFGVHIDKEEVLERRIIKVRGSGS